MISNEMKEKATHDLQNILQWFNAGLQAWESTTGCHANFQWNYQDGKKALEIASIDMPIYRKPVRGADDLRTVLENPPKD